jgi:hypothetical protein
MKKTLLFLLFVIAALWASAQSWKLTGNSGLATSNFLGSTDSKDVIFKTNNIERGRLVSTGSWRFGTSTNFVAIDSTGAFTFGGLGTYRVAANKYVFQYATNPNYGLFFNSSIPQYEFRNGSAAPVFLVNANTGNGVFNGTLKVGSYTLPSTDGTNGQVLKTNGAGSLSWTNDNNTIYTAGTGINISGTSITNTAPDQLVTLTGSGATSITGAYPNFTVSSTDNNTIYSSGIGINISGNTITNAAPDQLVTLTGSGATSVTGSYPNFTISSTDNNTIYTAGAGIDITGTVISNTAPTGWALGGNSGTDTSTNFIGTTDAQSLVFKINNTRAGVIDLAGNASLGYQSLNLNTIANANVAIGAGALYNNTSRNNLVAVGDHALFNDGIGLVYPPNIFGSGNTGIGSSALYSTSMGYENTATGFQAMAGNIGGWENTATGYQAMCSATGSQGNTANGYQALVYNLGSFNTGVGYQTLNGRPSPYDNGGEDNTAVGAFALAVYSGNENTAIGYQSMGGTRGGSYNSAFGVGSLVSGSGSYNTGIGYHAGGGLGSNNVAVGAFALESMSGDNNTVNGFNSGYSNNGSNNSFFGCSSGYSNLSGDSNVAIGNHALYANVDASNLVAVGDNALYSNTSGTFNTTIGAKSLYSNTSGSGNTIIGFHAGYSNTIGSSNVAMGSHALYGNLGGSNLVAIGDSSLYSDTSGTFNTAIGSKSLFSNTTGSNNAVTGLQAGYMNTTGGGNSYFGTQAGYSNQTGVANTAIGISALFNTNSDNNTAMGWGAGHTYGNSFGNTFIGSQTDANGVYAQSACLGHEALITASFQIRIGAYYVTSIGGFAGWSNFSDGRFKKNIKENVPGLEFIKALKPITYTMDVKGINDYLRKDIPKIKDAHGNAIAQPNEDEKATAQKEKIIYTGFIAQDVEKAAKKLGFDFSGVDAPKNDKDLYGLRYAEFVVPLVKAVQELSAQNDTKDEAITALQKENKDQQQAINELIARLDKLEQTMSKCCPAAQSSVAETEIQLANTDNAKLEQNVPNPFSQATYIKYYLPASVKQAQLLITDVNGNKLKLQAVLPGYGKVTVKAGELASGTYTYTLYADGKIVDSKKMVITK